MGWGVEGGKRGGEGVAAGGEGGAPLKGKLTADDILFALPRTFNLYVFGPLIFRSDKQNTIRLLTDEGIYPAERYLMGLVFSLD